MPQVIRQDTVAFDHWSYILKVWDAAIAEDRERSKYGTGKRIVGTLGITVAKGVT